MEWTAVKLYQKYISKIKISHAKNGWQDLHSLWKVSKNGSIQCPTLHIGHQDFYLFEQTLYLFWLDFGVRCWLSVSSFPTSAFPFHVLLRGQTAFELLILLDNELQFDGLKLKKSIFSSGWVGEKHWKYLCMKESILPMFFLYKKMQFNWSIGRY